MNDLFGVPINELLEPVHRDKPKKRYTPKGYATRPGSGPKGETCGTCEFAKKVNGGRRHYWKCWLVRQNWTSSYGTDIRLKSPACSRWELSKLTPFKT